MIYYILNDINKSNTFELLFQGLKNRKLDFKILLLNESVNENEFTLFCKKSCIPVIQIKSKYYSLVLIRIFILMLRRRPKIVHTHLMKSGLLGGGVAWLLRIKVRIYTKHHGDQHIIESPHALKYDRLINFFHNKIIALSKTQLDQILQTEKPNKPVTILHHSFDQRSFNYAYDRKEIVRRKLQLNQDKFNIMVNARWIQLKGIQFIIPAFVDFHKIYPDSILWLFNCYGDYSENINELLKVLPVNSYREIKFEEEIISVYFLMNAFIHVPIRKTAESFGQVYIEAMAAGLPSVFTLSGIANEICCNNENCIVVPYENKEEIVTALIRLREDIKLVTRIKMKSKEIIDKFELNKHIDQLCSVYSIKC